MTIYTEPKFIEVEGASTHRYDTVNPLRNPVCHGDKVIAASGDIYQVQQHMNYGYRLIGKNSSDYCGHSQIAICSAIYDLINA